MRRSHLILFFLITFLSACHLSEKKKIKLSIKIEDTNGLNNDSIIHLINERICNFFKVDNAAISLGQIQNNIYSCAVNSAGYDSTTLKKLKRLFVMDRGVGFWNVYSNSETVPWFVAANDSLKKDIHLPPIDSNEIITPYSTGERFRKQNPIFAIFTANFSIKGPTPMGEGVAGVCKAQDTLDLMRYLKSEKLKDIFPKNIRFIWSLTTSKHVEGCYELYCLIPDHFTNGPSLELGPVISANRVTDKNYGSNSIEFVMNKRDAPIWSGLTQKSVGHSIAISVGGKICSAPTVMSAIEGGHSSITGNFSNEEADELAGILRAGKLPFKASVINVEVIK